MDDVLHISNGFSLHAFQCAFVLLAVAAMPLASRACSAPNARRSVRTAAKLKYVHAHGRKTVNTEILGETYHFYALRIELGSSANPIGAE